MHVQEDFQSIHIYSSATEWEEPAVAGLIPHIDHSHCGDISNS